MSFSRRITLAVILTLTLSALSTVFTAPEANGDPNHILPVAATVAVHKQPAILTALTHAQPLSRSRMAFPEVGHATTAIVTQAAKTKVTRQVNTLVSNSRIETVIEFAKSQIGDPYVWGGNGPNGWDCSGLMVGSFSQIGVNLPRTSRAQFTVGSPIEYGQWAPGDLLFFGSSASSIHHVVLYIGNGQIIHASTFGVPVKIDTVRGGGSDYFGAKRVI